MRAAVEGGVDAGTTAAVAAPGPGAVASARGLLRDRGVWRDAALAWVAPRMLYLLMTALAPSVALTTATRGRPSGFGWVPWVWSNWDAAHYATIAQGGYTQPLQAAFYPLFPLLVRALTPLTLGDTRVAGLVVANVCALGALVVVRTLAELEIGRAGARRALVYLALFPMGVFLAAGYSESLFLLLSAGAFLALRERRWWLAGGLAALASLARPVGVLLALPLALEAWRALRAGWPVRWPVRWRAELAGVVAAPVLPLGGFAGFALYLKLRFGALSTALAAESSGDWRRQLSWPWDGPVRALAAALRNDGGQVIHVALDLGYTALFVALTVAALRRLPLAYGVYCAATLAVILLLPMHGHDWAALASNGRFLVVTFPLFFALGQWGERRWVHLAVVVASSLLLVLTTLAWVAGAFVA